MFAEMNIKFMFGKKGILSYRALVVLFVFLGCLLQQIWYGNWQIPSMV